MKIKSGKLDRIPGMYSDDLMGVVSAMIQQEPDKRPTVDMLQAHPQVQVRIKEGKLKVYREGLKRKEYELAKRMDKVREKEAEVERRRAEIREKEERLRQMERALEEQETAGGRRASVKVEE